MLLELKSTDFNEISQFWKNDYFMAGRPGRPAGSRNAARPARPAYNAQRACPARPRMGRARTGPFSSLVRPVQATQADPYFSKSL